MSKDYVEIDGKKIRVFRLCDYDAVAAMWYEDAVDWYKNFTGLDDDELYLPEEVEIINPKKLIRENLDTEETTTVENIVKEHWKNEPFIAVTYE